MLEVVADGLFLGLIYALLASGLALVFGLLFTINFAQGAFYMAGAFVAYEVGSGVHSLVVGIIVAAVGLGAAGVLLQRYLLARLTVFNQFIATFGIAIILQEGANLVWGGLPRTYPVPVSGLIRIGSFDYPAYRVVVMACSAVILGVLILLLYRTRIGVVLRAAAESGEIASTIGINVPLVGAAIFGLGTALAAVSGGLVLPIYGGDAYMGVPVLVASFAIVILGGLGSFAGSVLAALVIGMTTSIFERYWPIGSDVQLYVIIAVVLIARPRGLLGRVGVGDALG